MSCQSTKKPQLNAGALVNSKVFSFMRGGEALRKLAQEVRQVAQM